MCSPVSVRTRRCILRDRLRDGQCLAAEGSNRGPCRTEVRGADDASGGSSVGDRVSEDHSAKGAGRRVVPWSGPLGASHAWVHPKKCAVDTCLTRVMRVLARLWIRCGRGGIGRRARFRVLWGKTRGGSIPLARTVDARTRRRKAARFIWTSTSRP